MEEASLLRNRSSCSCANIDGTISHVTVVIKSHPSNKFFAIALSNSRTNNCNLHISLRLWHNAYCYLVRKHSIQQNAVHIIWLCVIVAPEGPTQLLHFVRRRHNAVFTERCQQDKSRPIFVESDTLCAQNWSG